MFHVIATLISTLIIVVAASLIAQVKSHNLGRGFKIVAYVAIVLAIAGIVISYVHERHCSGGMCGSHMSGCYGRDCDDKMMDGKMCQPGSSPAMCDTSKNPSAVGNEIGDHIPNKSDKGDIK